MSIFESFCHYIAHRSICGLEEKHSQESYKRFLIKKPGKGLRTRKGYYVQYCGSYVTMRCHHPSYDTCDVDRHFGGSGVWNKDTKLYKEDKHRHSWLLVGPFEVMSNKTLIAYKKEEEYYW